MSFIPRVHEIYKHFKGDLYQVTAIAEHSETGELLVVYQAMYGDFKTYARPLAMFVERVDREKYPDAHQEFRFQLQGPEAGRQAAESQSVQEKALAQELHPMQAKVLAAESQPVQEKALADELHPMQAKNLTEESHGHGGEPASEDQTLQEAELELDPLLLEFLDSDSYEQKLNILAGLHHRITEEMLTTMAIACDIEIGEGDIEERYEALRACLLTMERYECNRLR